MHYTFGSSLDVLEQEKVGLILGQGDDAIEEDTTRITALLAKLLPLPLEIIGDGEFTGLEHGSHCELSLPFSMIIYFGQSYQVREKKRKEKKRTIVIN